ncbi:MAG: coiled-coil domain-containing protein [Thermodesulfobacteriota bacterium]
MAEITKKDLFDALTEFYGKMIEPEFRAIRGKLDEHDQRFKDLLDHFDRIYTRLETEYYTIVAAIERMEKRLDKVEQELTVINQKLDKEISIREIIEKEIKDLKQRVSTLQERIEELEKRLKTFS